MDDAESKRALPTPRINDVDDVICFLKLPISSATLLMMLIPTLEIAFEVPKQYSLHFGHLQIIIKLIIHVVYTLHIVISNDEIKNLRSFWV